MPNHNPPLLCMVLHDNNKIITLQRKRYYSLQFLVVVVVVVVVVEVVELVTVVLVVVRWKLAAPFT